MHIISDFIKHNFYFDQKHPLKLEEFYFKMMSSMRKFRMQIPTYLTTDFIQHKYLELHLQHVINNNYHQLIIISYRINHQILFHYQLIGFNNFFNQLKNFTIDIFKDEWYPTGILSTINTFKPQIKLASIFANENLVDDVLILNKDNRIARTTLGDIFLIKKNQIITIPENEGYTTQILSELVKLFLKKQKFCVSEKKISFSEVQMSDEMFIVSEEKGIIPIFQIKNTKLSIKKTQTLFTLFNNYLSNK